MSWTEYVIDGTMDAGEGIFCFCSIDKGDYVTGVNYISDRPPDGTRPVGVIHLDGQKAADAFYEKHKEAIAKILDKATDVLEKCGE